ncbi:MAG: Gfo/Idh/MocA family oxidoreductase [Isosphaeraceae bacterium]
MSEPDLMNVLVLGNDSDSLEFVSRLAQSPGDFQIINTCPPVPGYPGTDDLEAALATSDIEAALICGPLESRGEWLRRAAGQGWVCLCLNPPGPNTDPYYQVALSNHEFGAIVIPNLPLRLHPGIQRIRSETGPNAPAGPISSIVIDIETDVDSQNLVLVPFTDWADVVRHLLGDVENIAAMGFPPGLQPTDRLTAQLRAAGEKRAELTIRTGTKRNYARLTVNTEKAVVTAAFDPFSSNAGTITIRRTADTHESPAEPLGQWDRYNLMINQWLETFRQKRPTGLTLHDGIRSMEVAEGAIRSLRRGRAIDLYYEEVSEANNFKTIMTSMGCLMVISVIFALPLILAGPALGLPFTLYLGYLIPLAMGGFVALQLLRLAIK